MEFELELENAISVNRYHTILGIPLIPLPRREGEEDDNTSDLGLEDILNVNNENVHGFEVDADAFTNAFSQEVEVGSFISNDDKNEHKHKKIVSSKLSRGTLKRKVTGDGNFVPTKLSVRKRNLADVMNYTPSSKRSKKRMVDAFVLGRSVSPEMVPISEGRRLLQVIHCICRDGGSVYNFFDKVPELVSSLREVALKDISDNEVPPFVSEFGNFETFLRATFKNTLCTVDKSEDYQFLPFVKYILQEKYKGLETMTATRMQALLGQICKENNTISREFPRFSYRKLGASKVSNVAFNIQIL